MLQTVSKWCLSLGLLVSVVITAPSAAEGADEVPAWTDAIPPQTMFVIQMNPSQVHDFARAISRRAKFQPDEQLFPAEDPVSTALGAFASGEVEDAIEGDDDQLRKLVFEHVDSERPVILTLSSAGYAYLLESARLGVPPTDAAKLRDRRFMRLIVPAEDAEKLDEELRATCKEGGLRCPEPLLTKAGDGHLWVDNYVDDPLSKEEKKAYEFQADTRYFERRSPAAMAFFHRNAGVSVYAKSGAFRTIATIEEGDYLARRVEDIDNAPPDERPFEIRQARRDVAETLFVDDLRSPATREIEDLAIFGWGNGEENLLIESVQTFTSYGAKLAKAGDVDVRMPVLGLARPVVAGSWRFDLRTAMNAASAPRWMADPLVGESQMAGLAKLFSESDGFAVFLGALNSPISAAAGTLGALENSKMGQVAKPSQYSNVVGGSFSFDIDPVRASQGGFGLEGGLAVALREGTVPAFKNLAMLGQTTLGTSIKTKTESQGNFSVMQFRVDTEREFTTTSRTRTTRLATRLNLDRMRAKLEVLGRDGPRTGWGLFELMSFVDGSDFRIETTDNARFARLKIGPYDTPEMTLSDADFELLDPESPPKCFVGAVRESKRLYVNAIDKGPYYRRRIRTRRSASTVRGRHAKPQKTPKKPEPKSAALESETIEQIRDLTETLGEAEKACSEEKGRWKADVSRIRKYWRDVLDGNAKTYPTPRDDAEKPEASE